MAPAERVLVPYDDLAELAGPEWPFGLRVDVWDGTVAPPDELGDVVLHVLPYGVPRAYEALDRLTGVRVIQSLRAGVDELLPLVAPDVLVTNGRGLHDASTAEHALALMLAAQRELPRWIHDQAARRWDPRFVGSLADRRVLLVGHGAIGGAIARRLEACEARVTSVARRARPDESVHAIDDLDRLLPEAEIVVLVVPDNPETRGLLDARRLALLPDGALVVNVGRGSAIDSDALVAEAGRLRAALDVVDPEPLPAEHPLWSAPGVLITPHVGGGSASFPPRARRLVIEQLRRFAAGEPLLNVIDRG
ncbi:2-hydroxyacid dehydrogenase [Patulibacter defluvii]|uniref:2-hydroxyacid dehydrogenase n=1 Tax=Patulibacter defluvii TaxID=3095358 RepID=UPI002A74A7A0|nr:2-hydroxyacid dehydrogenase [Patulibacter sp. DM4]